MRTPGYLASKDQVQKRLARIEGQVRGVSKMVEEDRYCIEVLTQISAAQAALDKVALKLVAEHAKHCVVDSEPQEQEEKLEELIAALTRLLGRG